MKVSKENILELAEKWSKSGSEQELHEYLGITPRSLEYLWRSAERLEHSKLFSQYGLTEEEEDALSDVMNHHDFDGWC